MFPLKELIEKRMKAVEDMRAILEKKDRTAEDNAQYEAFHAEQKALGDEIKRQQRFNEIQEELEKPTTRALPASSGKEAINVQAAQERCKELQMQVFNRYLQIGERVQMSAEYAELRSLNAGTLTEGGAFIAPQQWVNELLKAVDNEVFVRQYARKFQVQGAASLGMPALDHRLDNFEWTTELSTGSLDTSLRTGLRELKPIPFRKRIKVSKTLERNATIPVEQLVREELAYIAGVTEEIGFLTGNGATAPLGLFTASDHGISTARDSSAGNTATSVTSDGLIQAMRKVKKQYRRNGKWIMHPDVLTQVQLLKDGVGRYIWQFDPDGNETILTKPVLESEYAPSTLTSGLYVGVFGDLSKYYIADDVSALEIQKLGELYAETNENGYIAGMSCDGMPVLQEAFSRVKLA
jgi:HK97 family phage major capsid protein